MLETTSKTELTAANAVGSTDVLFVRDDGLFAVARIDDGKLAMTQDGTNAAKDWTHVLAVGRDVLFVRNDGLFAIARIDTASSS
jgi:hypothetical protein